MRFQKLILKNYCQFARAEFCFNCGAIGIVGPNGSGKSNLLHALYAALTGDFSRNAGVRSSNIRVQAEDGDESWICLEAEHSGQSFRVLRSLRPEKHVLELQGEPELRGASAVNQRLERLLGVNRRILNEYVFVEQWKMFSVLMDDPAERKESLLRMCGLQVLSQLHRQLQEYRQRFWAQRLSLQDVWRQQLQQVQIEQDRLQSELQLALQERVRWELQLPSPEKLELVRKQLPEFRMRQQHLSRLRELEASIRDLQNELSNCLLARPDDEDVWSALEQQLDRSAEAWRQESEAYALQEASQQLLLQQNQAARQQFEKDLERYRLLEQEFREAQARLLALEQNPPEFSEELTEDQLLEQLALTSAAAERSGAALRERLLREESWTHCPVCLQDLPRNPDDRAQWRQRLFAVIQSDTEDLQTSDLLQRLKRRQADAARYSAWQSALDAARQALAAAQARLPERPEPPVLQEIAFPEPPPGLLEWCIWERAGRNRVREGREQWRLWQQRMHFLQTSLQLQEQAAEDVRSQLRKLPADEEWLFETEHDYQDYLQQAAQLQSVWQQIQVRIEVLQTRLQDLKQQQETLQRQLEKAKRWRDWDNRCAAMAYHIHRDQLPTRMLREILDYLQEEINASLEQFDGRFQAYVDEQAEFHVRFVDGSRQPAQRLSGAEKMILALSVRRALYSLFQPRLGVMAWDEPTAGLDERYAVCLEQVLRKLGSQARERETQVLIVTHEERLQSAFDQVLALSCSEAAEAQASCLL